MYEYAIDVLEREIAEVDYLVPKEKKQEFISELQKAIEILKEEK